MSEPLGWLHRLDGNRMSWGNGNGRNQSNEQQKALENLKVGDHFDLG